MRKIRPLSQKFHEILRFEITHFFLTLHGKNYHNFEIRAHPDVEKLHNSLKGPVQT